MSEVLVLSKTFVFIGLCALVHCSAEKLAEIPTPHPTPPTHSCKLHLLEADELQIEFLEQIFNV
jgi:hypothetical protein